MLKRLTRAEVTLWLVPLLLLVTYGGVPLALGLLGGDEGALSLAGITLVGTVAFLLGWQIRLASRFFLVSVDINTLMWAVWIPFILFACLAWVTAERIPLLASLQGASPAEVSLYREKFLKAREGWQHAFVYIHAVMTSALIPYLLAMMFYYNTRAKWYFFLFFLFYCLSFVEKSYFIRSLVPLLFLVSQGRVHLPLKPSHMILLGLGLLMLVTLAAGSGTEPVDTGMDFWSAGFAPQGALQHLVWRAVAIPVITAIDSIRTFHQTFDGHYFHGATSTLFSSLAGLRYVEFERAVFWAQWGQNETATGSSNSVYLVEAFVNWGYLGVTLISLALGALFRYIRDSRDPCLQAMWLLFFFGIYTSGFIGTMVSNGYLLLFSVVSMVRVRTPDVSARPAQGQR